MIIKETLHHHKIESAIGHGLKTIGRGLKTVISVLKDRKIALAVLGLIFMGGYTSFIFLLGAYAVPSQYIEDLPFLEAYAVPYRYLEGLTVETERIEIDMKQENMQKLLNWRSQGIQKGTLFGIAHDYVKAQIRSKEGTVPVGVKLKGFGVHNHLVPEKWSMRVKVKDSKTLFGFREFALMDPKRRNYMLEWLYRKVGKREGLIYKDYKFVEVIINGENKGIYVLDEHHGKILVERNQRRDGPILRHRTSDYVLYELPDNSDVRYFYFRDFYYWVDIDVYDQNRLQKDEVTNTQLKKALSLLRAFRDHDLSMHEVFDVDKMAKWFAIGDIFGAWHEFTIGNVRFYYNPVTSKFEPIPDDSFDEMSTDPGRRVFRLDDPYSRSIDPGLDQIFGDDIFMAKYIEELERVSQKSYFDDLFNEMKDEIDTNLKIIRRDNPSYVFPMAQLYKNQHALRSILGPPGVIAYVIEKRVNGLLLGMANIKSIPVEVLNVTYGEDIALEPEKESVVLRGKGHEKPLVFHEFEFRFPEGFDRLDSLPELKVKYKFAGTKRILSGVVSSGSYIERALIHDSIRDTINLQDFHFVKVDPSKKIYIQPGHWVLSKNLIFPQGYTVYAEGGTTIDLTNGAKILSYSPVWFIGSDNDPVVISSSDSSGQGMTVLSAGRESLLQNVVFDNLSTPSEAGWQLTGAVTFYRSPVKIHSCSFLGSRSEDALNIIHSQFTIHSSLFKNSASDALDIDFGEGTIVNTSFIDSYNDAADFSGSIVDISASYIEGSGDKGISVGERSQVTAKQMELKRNRIGVASKDMSEVIMEASQIHGSGIGLAVYQKKPEFGGAAISGREIEFSDTRTRYLVEQGSSLILNYDEIKGDQTDVISKVDGTL